jgi:TolB protein
LFLCSSNVSAVITIEVTQGVESALPIAIVPFATDAQQSALPVNITEVITADLERSGRFAPIPPERFPSQPHEFSTIQFDDWRRLGVENLVVGKLMTTPLGEYAIEFRLVDVYKGTQLIGYNIETTRGHLRLAAHRIADIIYEQLTGERGAFATRISYITVRRDQQDKKTYELQLADTDGHNVRTLLESDEPLLSPAWAPDGRRIAYVSFEGRNSAIYVQDIATGTRDEVASNPGINSAPAWSPDGGRLAMTLSKDGNPEIYVLHLRTRRLQRVTSDSAIDTEPAWSPDGRKLVFTSDRSGSPQIYEVDVTGGSPQRVTFNMGSYNARASYSPDGRLLTMVHRDEGGYRIAVMDLERQQLTVLTDTRLDESPSFAPNGSMIIYATVGSQGTELAATSVDGDVRHRLALRQGEVREPAWGPFRK